LVSDWLHVSLLTKILTLKFSRMLPNFHNNWETLLGLLNAVNKSQKKIILRKIFQITTQKIDLIIFQK